MNSKKYIDEIKEEYSEWLEHAEYPQDLLISILASKQIALREYTQYLEKINQHLQHIQKEKV